MTPLPTLHYAVFSLLLAAMYDWTLATSAHEEPSDDSTCMVKLYYKLPPRPSLSIRTVVTVTPSEPSYSPRRQTGDLPRCFRGRLVPLSDEEGYQVTGISYQGGSFEQGFPLSHALRYWPWEVEPSSARAQIQELASYLQEHLGVMAYTAQGCYGDLLLPSASAEIRYLHERVLHLGLLFYDPTDHQWRSTRLAFPRGGKDRHGQPCQRGLSAWRVVDVLINKNPSVDKKRKKKGRQEAYTYFHGAAWRGDSQEKTRTREKEKAKAWVKAFSSLAKPQEELDQLPDLFAFVAQQGFFDYLPLIYYGDGGSSPGEVLLMGVYDEMRQEALPDIYLPRQVYSQALGGDHELLPPLLEAWLLAQHEERPFSYTLGPLARPAIHLQFTLHREEAKPVPPKSTRGKSKAAPWTSPSQASSLGAPLHPSLSPSSKLARAGATVAALALVAFGASALGLQEEQALSAPQEHEHSSAPDAQQELSCLPTRPEPSK